ncbi:MAG: rhodanese-like domain-containing protein [bacterium]|nr:rhodanese-like domain-containing protein [bacterium]
MNNPRKNDFLKAFILLFIVAVAAIVLNWLRTPVLFAMADQGNISRAKAHRMEGVRLFDDWTHGGWIEVSPQNTSGNNGNRVDNQDPPDGPDEPQMSEIIEVDIVTAKEYFDEGEIQFLDAQETESYEEAHIPGALNWPYDYFDTYLEKYKDEITKDTAVLCYCNGDSCDGSYILAESLMYEYYQVIYLYKGGIEEWQAWGYPVNTGAEP